MLPSRFLAVLAVLACAALSFPVAGFAQGGAGDDQYGDPLGPDTGGGTTDGSGQTPTAGGGGTTGTAPPTSSSSGSPTAPAPGTPTATGPPVTTVGSTTEGAPTAPGELPNTGADPALVAIFGLAMVLMGTGALLAVPRRE